MLVEADESAPLFASAKSAMKRRWEISASRAPNRDEGPSVTGACFV
jgi:hypothetical protein